MILYHGGCAAIEHPDLKHSREHLDFGKGFYLFEDEDAAAYWAAARTGADRAVVSKYELDTSGLGVRRFDIEMLWLQFVGYSRGFDVRAKYITEGVDVFCGPTADDRLFSRMADHFVPPLFPTDTGNTVHYLSAANYRKQVAVTTEKALKGLTYLGCTELTSEECEACIRRGIKERGEANLAMEIAMRKAHGTIRITPDQVEELDLVDEPRHPHKKRLELVSDFDGSQEKENDAPIFYSTPEKSAGRMFMENLCYTMGAAFEAAYKDGAELIDFTEKVLRTDAFNNFRNDPTLFSQAPRYILEIMAEETADDPVKYGRPHKDYRFIERAEWVGFMLMYWQLHHGESGRQIADNYVVAELCRYFNPWTEYMPDDDIEEAKLRAAK